MLHEMLSLLSRALYIACASIDAARRSVAALVGTSRAFFFSRQLCFVSCATFDFHLPLRFRLLPLQVSRIAIAMESGCCVVRLLAYPFVADLAQAARIARARFDDFA